MKKINLSKHRVRAIFGFCLTVFGVIYLKYAIPPAVNHRVSKRIVLKDGWPMRNIWSKWSSPHEYHVYFFDVINPDEVVKGEKPPIVKEVGPYIYDVWLERIDMVDHEEDDTLSYKLKKTFIFNATKSHPLTEEDEVTLADLIVLGTANNVLKSRPFLLPLASRSVDSLFNKPDSPFDKVSVKKYLFDGFQIDCVGVEEFFAKVVCNDAKEFWFDYRFIRVREDYYSSSFLSSFNNTMNWVGESRINRGIKNITKIGEFVEYNNTNNFAIWDNEKCDAFVGTDGTMFRPFLSRTDNLHVINTDLGRSFTYQYDSEVTHNGIDCFRYTASIGTDSETNPEDKCYCLAPDRCLKNGVFESFKATHWPCIVSNPHLYLADPYYSSKITGLNPNREKHLSIIDVHPLTGTVVSAKFRVQWNEELTKQPKYRVLKNIYETLLPMMWYEERFTLPEPDVRSLKKLSSKIAFEKLFIIMIIVSGVMLFVVGVAYEIALKYKLVKSKT